MTLDVSHSITFTYSELEIKLTFPLKTEEVLYIT